MKNLSARELWETALGELQIQVSRPNYRTWFEKTEGSSLQDNHLIVSVPNTFVAEYLDKSQRALIEKTLMGITSSADIRVSFQVNGHLEVPSHRKSPLTPAPSNLNPNYVFRNFVVGNNNRIAFEAAREVAAHAGQSFNPLFIHGGVGLGKTHLLHAIGHEAIANRMLVCCLSAEQFTNEFITAVRERRMDDFRARYRQVDMLLIDDISFISGKEQTEECFFHTFNDLHNADKQIVITSNQAPNEIPLVEERLRSRLQWGLVADIQPPDFETRLAVLKAKAEQKGASLAPDILELIAQQIKNNIRELEGSLNRVIAYARLLRASPTLTMAQEALKNMGSTGGEKTQLPSPSFLLQAVADSFHLTPEDLKGSRRDKEAVLARRVAMYLLRQETTYSITQIAQELGGRDPSSVTHACKKLAAELEGNQHLRRVLQDIQKKLKS